MMDCYPVMPDMVLHQAQSNTKMSPLRGGRQSLSGMGRPVWDEYLQQMQIQAEIPLPPPASPSQFFMHNSQLHNTHPAAPKHQHNDANRIARSAEVKQRVISELARQLHVRVNQKLTQRRQEVLSEYRLEKCSGTAEVDLSAQQQQQNPQQTQQQQGSSGLAGMNLNLNLGRSVDPQLAAELSALPLPELMQRAFPYGNFPSKPSIELVEGVPASGLPDDTTTPPSSAACPMGEVVFSSASESTGQKAYGSSASGSVVGAGGSSKREEDTDHPAACLAKQTLEQMNGLVQREVRGRMREDIGLMRVNRLKGVPKFNRGIYAGLPKKRGGRSGLVFGGDEGDRVMSSSQQMITGGGLFEWLHSFSPISMADEQGLNAAGNASFGPLDDGGFESTDNPFSFAVLRDLRKNGGDANNLSARWCREQLTRADRARMNARHSRYHLSHADDSFSSLMGSISALVLREYGKDLSEEQREDAKKRLKYLREKEKANQQALPYIRNNFPPNPHEIQWRKRQNSSGTVVFDEHRVKLPLGARYVPGVGFVNKDNQRIAMSTQEEEELLRFIKRLPHGDGDPSEFFELNQQDLERLEEMQNGAHLLPGQHSRPGSGRVSGHSASSIGMSKTMTMEQAAQLPAHRIHVSQTPSPSETNDTSSTDDTKEEGPKAGRGTSASGTIDSGVTLEKTSQPTRSSSSSRRRGDWQERRALSVAEDEEKLDLFLARFPESQRHVKLRKDANAVLSSLEPLALNNSLSFFDNPLDDGVGVDGKDLLGEVGSTSSFPSNVSDPPIHGFMLDEAILRERFRKEAEEENRALTNERNKLRIEVDRQRKALLSFLHDVEYLSYGDGTLTGDEYAAYLTRDVNQFAKMHSLRLNELEIVNEDGAEDSGVTLQRTQIGHSFLDQFGSRRAITKSVAIQVTEEDLGLVDESAKLAVEQMEDLMYHERALMDSIRLATIAVANVMSFHASLELESTCKECFYLFEHPRTLWPCGHTFCQQCISGMYNANDELVCAECGSLCDVGYTPNLSVEVVAHYQMVQESEEKGMKRNKKLTIEGVLRRLLNDLLATQKRCAAPSTALPGVSPPLSPKAHKAKV